MYATILTAEKQRLGARGYGGEGSSVEQGRVGKWYLGDVEEIEDFPLPWVSKIVVLL